jgi:hypothetical protein
MPHGYESPNLSLPTPLALVAQVVEHFFGKEEVMSSSLIEGSISQEELNGKAKI